MQSSTPFARIGTRGSPLALTQAKLVRALLAKAHGVGEEAIFIEASLSFIGVGIRPPQPSWGQMVGAGQAYIQSVPHLLLFPCLAIALTMLAFTFLGDGLRDALDVRMNE